MRSRFPLLILLLAAGLAAPPAFAVIVDPGGGTQNTIAPPDDPGWDYVGTIGGLTAVYLRNGWVLTADHVPTGPVRLGGQLHQPIAGSETRLEDAQGNPIDLKLFGIHPEPDLPELPIRADTSLPSGEVILIGKGRDRGPVTDSDDPNVWSAPPNPPSTPIEGYVWESTKSLRWGTNEVLGYWPGDPFGTRAFYMIFDEPGSASYTSDEAQAADGDSGGAVFARNGPDWELAGILYVIGLHQGQVNNSALYGNFTGAADLAVYRDEIMALTAVPEPGLALQLVCGVAGLAWLERCRRPRG